MAWRSLVVTQPARMSLCQRALRLQQDDLDVRIPLEDVAVVVIDQPQVLLTAALLSAMADAGIAVITVNNSHHPNGVLLPYLPHSRTLKVLRAQINLGLPHQKQLWKHIVRRKIANQASVLELQGHEQAARRLTAMVKEVRSGDTHNLESQAARLHFRTLLGKSFTRRQERLHNYAMDYSYAIVRSAIARSLVMHGFVTALGLHHRNEQNAFNLADDLLEPFRPIVDLYVLQHFPRDSDERELNRADKAQLVRLLHHDIGQIEENDKKGRCTVLTGVENAVISLIQRLNDGGYRLCLPQFPLSAPQ